MLLTFLEERAATIFRIEEVLKTDAACSSETLVNIYKTAQHHMPEDGNLLIKFIKKL
jgi:hypothetical protein